MTRRKLSPAQTAYTAARTAYDAADTAMLAHERRRAADAWPAPADGSADFIYAAQADAYMTLRAAAFALFDWMTATTLANNGTAAEKAAILAAIASVKKMHHDRPFFQRLVGMSMNLAA